MTVGLLQEMNALALAKHVAKPKPVTQIANELFTALFVLQSEFKFKPVFNKPYWLYHHSTQHLNNRQNHFKLSLISPQEWKDNAFGEYIGECELHKDMTWTMTLSDQIQADSPFMLFLKNQREKFDQRIQQQEKLDDVLPGYVKSRPFYQRAFISALSVSLGHSMQRAGIAGSNFDQALLLEQEDSGHLNIRHGDDN